MSGTVVASSWWIAQADPTPVDFEGLVDDSLGSADWIRAGAIVLGSIVVAVIANRVARKVGERTIGPGFASLLIARTIGYVIVLVGIIYALGGLGLDGTWIRIPNSKVLKDPIVTMTTEHLRRSRLTVGVADDTDLDRVTQVIGEALDRVARVCDDPAPLVVLREFGRSSIDIDVYYWHASDVPAELAATHDVMLAIHQAFAAEGITIAFPQMVVWSGRDAHVPYAREPTGEVYTEHAAVPGGRERSVERTSGGWLPWCRG